MKRTLALALVMLLALAMLLSGCSQKEEEPKLTGTWKLTTIAEGGEEYNVADLGLEMTLEINEDGTYKIAMTGEDEETGNWEKTDKGIAVTSEGETLEFVLDGENLKADDDGATMIFAR